MLLTDTDTESWYDASKCFHLSTLHFLDEGIHFFLPWHRRAPHPLHDCQCRVERHTLLLKGMRWADVIAHDWRQPTPHLLIIYSSLFNLFYNCAHSTTRAAQRSRRLWEWMYSSMHKGTQIVTSLIIQGGITAGFETTSLEFMSLTLPFTTSGEVNTLKISLKESFKGKLN